jgi:hypothetical protein
MTEQRLMSLADITEAFEEQFDGENFDSDSDSDVIREHLEELVEIHKIERCLHGDDVLYRAYPDVTWANIHMIDCKYKKSILLYLIKNPATFFVLQQAQSGKMKICAIEMKQWSREPNIKPVAVFVTQNDKTLADQSAEGIRAICGELNAEMFVLSSNSKTSITDIIRYIDAYENPRACYKMPVIVVLANPNQHKKVLEILDHILNAVHDPDHTSILRYGIIFDEADDTYPKLRNKSVHLNGRNVSYLDYINDEVALHRLGFVTASEGNLLDEDYPECANAYLYPVEIDETQRANFRGFHSNDTIINIKRHPSSMSNNAYAESILDSNKEYFIEPIKDRNDKIYYRKIIINSDARVAKMRSLAAKCNRDGIHAMVFNQSGVTLYHANRDGTKRFKVRGERFSEVLYYIYKTENLNDRPLAIIGRRKVDRGLGFHGIPRLREDTDNILNGVNGPISINGIDGLVWTDMIVGHIENAPVGVQKTGRLQGIVAQCPQFTTITYWTDQSTSDMILYKCKTTDHVNKERGCSLIQAMSHATDRHPRVVRNHDVPYRDYRVFDNETITKQVCAALGYRYRATSPNSAGFRETSLNMTRDVASLLSAIKKVPSAYGKNNGIITWRTAIPCYTNVNDPTTLRFVVVIRPETTDAELTELDANYPSIHVPQTG